MDVIKKCTSNFKKELWRIKTEKDGSGRISTQTEPDSNEYELKMQLLQYEMEIKRKQMNE